MQNNSSDEKRADDLKIKFSPEDMAKLFNYPSIGQLFSEKETEKLDNFFARLTTANEDLERVIRYGNKGEAEKAGRASEAVKITLEFLKNLEEMRTTEKK